MGIQLKAELLKDNVDLDSIKFEDMFNADSNTRYRYTIAKMTREEKAYILYKKNAPFYYKTFEDNIRALPLWPGRQACEICIEQDDIFKGAEIAVIDKKTLYHELLSDLHKKKIFVSIYVNLQDVIELPAREFKIDWFEYMFYNLKQDWMFDD